MRWKVRPNRDERRRQKGGRLKFAWLPTKIWAYRTAPYGYHRVWLEFYWREWGRSGSGLWYWRKYIREERPGDLQRLDQRMRALRETLKPV